MTKIAVFTSISATVASLVMIRKDQQTIALADLDDQGTASCLSMQGPAVRAGIIAIALLLKEPEAPSRDTVPGT